MGLNTTLQSSGIPLFALHRGAVRRFSETQQHPLGAMTISEASDAFTIYMDVPGFKSADIEIELEDQQLVITGNKRTQPGQRDEAGISAVMAGSFKRVLHLKTSVNREQAVADLKDGVLVLRLPLETKPKHQRVSIRTPANQIAQ